MEAIECAGYTMENERKASFAVTCFFFIKMTFSHFVDYLIFHLKSHFSSQFESFFRIMLECEN